MENNLPEVISKVKSDKKTSYKSSNAKIVRMYNFSKTPFTQTVGLGVTNDVKNNTIQILKRTRYSNSSYGSWDNERIVLNVDEAKSLMRNLMSAIKYAEKHT